MCTSFLFLLFSFRKENYVICFKKCFLNILFCAEKMNCKSILVANLSHIEQKLRKTMYRSHIGPV